MNEGLREIPRVRQHADSALRRRWFTCDRADLFVFDDEGEIRAFELCYDKPQEERSLHWSDGQGFSHARVDGGESTPFDNQTPINIAQGGEDREHIALVFESLAAAVDPFTYRTILRVLLLGR